MSEQRRTVAVVGSGVSGLTAAYLLRDTADVTLFEASDRVGGHVHTHHPQRDDGSTTAVDSGFIVCNDRTYPTLLRLFDELGVVLRPTEMSMGISCDGCGLQFVGGRGLRGVFAQRRRVVDPRFWRLLLGVRRFQRLALAHLADHVDSEETYGEFLTRHRFSADFVNHYAVPVVSCVWSSGHDDALRYPAGYLFAFLRNHGFLDVRHAPQWYVVEGGSSSYVDKILETLHNVVTATSVTSVTRHHDGVTLAGDAGELGRFDAVVLAAHADETLAMLSDATLIEKDALGAFAYSRNDAVLHGDDSVLPRDESARGGWNYRMSACAARGDRVQVSYWMNRLQHHDERWPLIVTLNPDPAQRPGAVLAEMSYAHPIYTSAARLAQRRLTALDTGLVVFAGAYHGWGFHEDGCASGAKAARLLGANVVTSTRSLTVAVPALVRGRVRHERLVPFRHGFSYGAHQWLIDADAADIGPGWLRRLASVRASDHIGPKDGSLGDNIRWFVKEQGADWTAHRVLMLTNARTLGYVFDPLTVFWCFAEDGRLEGVVAEVHNTYGERHGYVVEVDDLGKGQTDKTFYVSPFFGVFGRYQLRFSLDGDRVGAFITLRQHGDVVFTASFTGSAVPLTTRRMVTSAIRHPFMPQRVALLIRLHGIWLWARRLPVVRR